MQLGETVRIQERLTAASAFTLTSAAYAVTNEATGAAVTSGSATITGGGTADQTISFLFTPAAVGTYLVKFTYVVSSETIEVTQRVRVLASPSGLEVLRQQLRDLIGDTAGTTQTFSDEELEEILDRWRRDQDATELIPVASFSAASGRRYLTFVSDFPHWGTQVSLQDSSYASLTPSAADPARGRWTFGTEPSYPVYATGASYDLFGAASEALTIWASRKARDYDFESNTQRFARSQMRAGLLEQARAMSQRAALAL